MSDLDITFYRAEGKECICGVSSFSHIHPRGRLQTLLPLTEGSNVGLSVGSYGTTATIEWKKELKKIRENWIEEPLKRFGMRLEEFIEKKIQEAIAQERKRILSLKRHDYSKYGMQDSPNNSGDWINVKDI